MNVLVHPTQGLHGCLLLERGGGGGGGGAAVLLGGHFPEIGNLRGAIFK